MSPSLATGNSQVSHMQRTSSGSVRSNLVGKDADPEFGQEFAGAAAALSLRLQADDREALLHVLGNVLTTCSTMS
jgi:hypothetical protein